MVLRVAAGGADCVERRVLLLVVAQLPLCLWVLWGPLCNYTHCLPLTINQYKHSWKHSWKHPWKHP